MTPLEAGIASRDLEEAIRRRTTRARPVHALLPLVLAVVAFNACLGYVAFTAATNSLQKEATARVNTYAAGMARTVARFALVPLLLSHDEGVTRVVAAPEATGPVLAVDRRFAELALETNIEVLYLVDRSGVTIASSNWDRPDSFVGQKFSYRPYLQAAIEGRPGQYIALGTTSGRLGYYLSYPIEVDGQVAGAVVAKLGTDTLERDWRGTPEIMLIADENGVIALTNHPEWRFRTIGSLTPEQRAVISETRRYPLQALTSLPMTMAGETAIVRSGPEMGTYVVASAPLRDDGSRIYIMAPIGQAWERSVAAVVLALAISAAGAAVYLVVRQRRARLHRRLEREMALRDLLEEKIAERTADLQAANQRLQDTRSELVQAVKLAALGQMSASLAHELSQPVAAIRSFAENGQVLVERSRWADVAGNLGEIVSMTERVARISQHLKAFARRSRSEIEPVPLLPAVQRCVALIGHRAAALEADIVLDIPDGLAVAAEEVRLEQVILNLLQNACDAVTSSDRRRILVAAEPGEDGIILSVQDSGPGIAPDVLPLLFNSFFTTKPAGQGLGLGLSISRDIVQDLGGRISAATAPGGGALFIIWLPAA